MLHHWIHWATLVFYTCAVVFVEYAILFLRRSVLTFLPLRLTCCVFVCSHLS